MTELRKKLEFEREVLFYETIAGLQTDIYNKAEEIAIKKIIIQTLIDKEKSLSSEKIKKLLTVDSASGFLYRYLRDYKFMESNIMDMLNCIF